MFMLFLNLLGQPYGGRPCGGAGFVFEQVGFATMVKLGRVILLGPLLLILSYFLVNGVNQVFLWWFMFFLMTLRSFFELPVGL